MAYQATVIPVLLASPGDASRERDIARGVIDDWNYVHFSSQKAVLMPVGWETHSSPELSGRPQELINNRVLAACDLLVGIFWTQLGTPTGDSASGTAEEIEKHLSAGKSAMVYFSTVPVAPDALDHQQYAALKEFRKWCEPRGLYWTFDSPDDLRTKFDRQLRIALQDSPFLQAILNGNSSGRVQQASSATLPLPRLTAEAFELLQQATLDQSGQILNLRVLSGDYIATNGKDYGQGEFGAGAPRQLAQWKHALEQLESEGLVRATGPKREIFEVPHAGYEAAESMRSRG